MIQQSNEINELGLMLKNGDTESFEKIYNKSIQWVRSDVYKHIKADDVDDCVQDIYVKLYNNIGQYNPEKGKFSTWFNTLVTNETINFARRYHTQMAENMEYIDDDENFDELVDLSATPEQYVENEEVKHIIAKLLGEINESQKSCISMVFIDDMSYKDTAKALGVSEGTVKSRVFNGLKKIRSSIEAMKKKGVAIFGVAPVPTFLYMLKNCNFTADAKTVEAGWAAISANNFCGTLSPAVELQSSSAAKASSISVTNEVAKHGLRHKILVGLAGALVAGGIVAGTLAYLSNSKNAREIKGNYGIQNGTVSYSTDNLKSAYEILVEKGELSEPIEGNKSGNVYIPEYVYKDHKLISENCLIYGFDNIDKVDEGKFSPEPKLLKKRNNSVEYNNLGEKVYSSHYYENKKWNYINNQELYFNENLYDDNGKSLLVNGEYVTSDQKFTFDEHGNITGYLERGLEDGNKDKYFYLYYSEFFYDDLGRINAQRYYVKYYNDGSNHDSWLTIDDIKNDEYPAGATVLLNYDDNNNVVSSIKYWLYSFDVILDSNGNVLSIIDNPHFYQDFASEEYYLYEYYYDGLLKASYNIDDSAMYYNIYGGLDYKKRIKSENILEDMSEYFGDEYMNSEIDYTVELKIFNDYFSYLNEHETIDNYYEESDGNKLHIQKKIYKDGFVDYDIFLINKNGQTIMKTDYKSNRNLFKKYIM